METAEQFDQEHNDPKFTKTAREVFVELLSDVEAWVTVDRIRRTSWQQGHKKRGRRADPS